MAGDPIYNWFMYGTRDNLMLLEIARGKLARQIGYHRDVITEILKETLGLSATDQKARKTRKMFR
jgi:hypothetical protein